ncbi:DUF2964 family protein [Trinickia violacea]|uniref:DUF2964 family protein n=1 Tax=Trinickia violacea TaxID=2571746 RepID=A0A4P8IY81_9BURK|nr:DUF2964 family protein [Trinickia violacea]QCP53386.1 DUF2964 family protein [Trinickia violacea]
MVRTEFRIVLAVIAAFVAIAGIAVAIHGMLFDQGNSLLYGSIAIGVGVFGCALLLNVWPKDMKDESEHPENQHAP